MSLYKFENLRKFVDRVAPSITEIKKKNLVVKDEDFSKFHAEGKTYFDDEGIYVIINGIHFRRYIFLKNYHISKYERFPVFHIIACSKVQDIGRYHYSSASTSSVDVIDLDTHTIHRDKKLKLCAYCRDECLSEFRPQDTKEFFDSLEKIVEGEVKASEIRPDGYTWDWDIVSEKMRQVKNYTCENPQCKIQVDNQFDRFLMHVHHKNGNKTYNNTKNLEVLCILCHAFKNEVHKDNFKKRRLLKQLDFFISKYRGELTKLKNPYLKEADILLRKDK
jgi:hypothetical protein